MTDPTPTNIDQQVREFREQLDSTNTLQPAIVIDEVLTLGRSIRDSATHELAIEAIRVFMTNQEREYVLAIIPAALSVIVTTSILAGPLGAIPHHFERLEAIAPHLQAYGINDWPLYIPFHQEGGHS